MPTRNISTKIAIEGESEYRSALSSINTELKTLQSALKLTESEFQTQQNTTAALEAKMQSLNSIYEQQKAKVQTLQKALDNAKSAQSSWADKVETAKQKLENATKAQEQYTKAGGNNKTVLDQLAKAEADARKELEQAQAGYNAATRGVANWEQQLNSAKIAENDTNAAIQKTQKYLDEARTSSDGAAKSINEFGEKMDTTKSSADDLAEALAASGIANAMQTVIDSIEECVNAFAEFEQGMAGVQRTTGMSSEEVDALGEEFKDMSTYMPITTTELADIATAAGQLGISNDNIESFTTVMAQLATTTDLTADSAATLLAQFSNIVQMDPSNYDRLGSTLAALGDSSATTASKVAEMSQGIAATASIAGMNEREILAIATAVGSVGVEAGSGSTAINTLISNITSAVQSGGDELQKFADVAGMSAGQFAAAWEYDAAGAFQAVIEGIGASDSATTTLSDLGITAARQTRVILSLAQAGDTLANSFDLADEAWEENTALGDKAEVMWSTVSASMTETNSALNNMKIALGDAIAPVLEPIVEKFRSMVEAITEFIQEHPKFSTACTAIVGGLAAITTAFLTFAAAKKMFKTLELGDLFKGIGNAASSAASSIGEAASAFGSFLAAGAGASFGAVALMLGADIVGTSVATKQFKQRQEQGTTTQDAITFGTGEIGGDQDLSVYAQNVEDLQERYDKLVASRQSYIDSGADVTAVDAQIAGALSELQEAQAEYDRHAEESTELTDDQAAAMEELGYSEEDVADMTQEEAAAIYDATAAMQEYTEAYQENYDAAREAIDGAVGLFDKLTADTDAAGTSMSDMETKWAEQVESIQEYQANLQKLSDYGIDTSFLTELSDGSEESVGYVQALTAELDGMDTSEASAAVDEFNAAWESTAEAKDSFADTCAGIETDAESVTTTVQSTLERMPNGMYTVGTSVIGNIRSGLSTGSSGLYAQVQTIVSTAIARAQAASGSGSTSTSSKGYASGTTSATKGFHMVGENGPELMWFDGGEQILDAVKTAELKNSASTESLMRSASGTKTGADDSRIISVLTTYLPKLLAKSNDTYLDGAVVSRHLAPSMDAALGRRKRLGV